MTVSGLKTPFWDNRPAKIARFFCDDCGPPGLLGNQVCGDILLTLTTVMVICDDVQSS